MIDDDVKITIYLNKLVEARARLQSQYGDYSSKICKGEYLDATDIDRIASKLRDTLTWDALFSMVDESILEYLDINETHYGETAGNEPAATFEKQAKKREKARKEFEMVDLVSSAWTIKVPRRIKK